MTESLVTVATFPTAVEGTLAKGCLQAAGIPAVLEGEPMGMALHLAFAVGRVKLQVAGHDAAEALEILRLAVEPER